MATEKKVPMAKVSVDEVKGELVWTFAHGGVQRVNVNDLAADIHAKAVLHGLKQTISDAYAGAKGDSKLAEGLAASRIQALLSGSWNAKAQAGQAMLDLIAAVCEVTGKEREEVEEKLGALDADAQKKLVKDARIAAVMARLKADRLAKAANNSDSDGDIDSLFAEV